ncbi:MAG: lipopolysaccharide biosynthesis protein [Syntrophales bacterium]
MPEFFRHVLTMLTGSVIAQAIPFAVSPILTRLYSPEEFGVFSSVLALAGILSVAITLRFELAVILPEQDKDAAAIVRLALISALVSTLGLSMLIPLFQSLLAGPYWLKVIGVWIYIVPPFACFIALQQVASFFANRFSAYPAIALGTVVQQGSSAAVAIVAGLWRFFANGLILSRFVGLAIGTAVIAWKLRERWHLLTTKVTLKEMRENALLYRQFPMFNVPYSFIGVFSKEFLVIAFTAFGHVEIAGFYGLARIMLTVPINFLTASMSQVFYREASLNVDTEGFRLFTYRLMKLLAIALVPLFGLVFCWSDQIFSFIFGAHWRQAGVYAAYLIPVAVLSLFTSWPERIFEVRRKQGWALGIQVTFDVTTVILVLALMSRMPIPNRVLGGYVAVQICYQLTYLAVVFRLVGISKKKYFGLLSTSMGLGSLVFLMHALWGAAFPWVIPRLIIETVFAVGISSVGLFFIARSQNQYLSSR